ncbi:MAG TPA: MATE family efflux transporter [Vicinamibacterales bacterium]|nr:MATE family efflux transporter [Vicinamibacterales bacterium]
MQDLTTGPLTRHLLKTTSFMLVSMIFQTLYILVDLFWVGRLGTDAIAAVGLAGNISFIVIALTQVLGVGATTLVSHASGKKDQDRAIFLFNQSQVLSMLVAAVFLIVAMMLRHQYAAGQSATDGMRIATEQYLLWFLPAMALQFAMVAMGAALRGTGNFKPGMIVQTATVVINMITAPFLIFGWGPFPEMGVSGAAVATFISIVVGVVWISIYFIDTNAYLRFHLGHSKPQVRVWWDMLKIGLPAGSEFALMGVYMGVIYAITKPFGAAAQGGFTIGLRVVQSAFLPVVALGFAVAPVAGQNFAARKGDRVRAAFKAAAGMAAAFMLIAGVGMFFSAPALMRIFTKDPEAIAVGVEYLRIVVLTFVPSGITFVSSSMFQALGNTIPPLATSTLRILIAAIPAIFLARLPGFHLTWIWYLGAIAVVLQMTLNLMLLQREFSLKLDGAYSPIPQAAGVGIITGE